MCSCFCCIRVEINTNSRFEYIVSQYTQTQFTLLQDSNPSPRITAFELLGLVNTNSNLNINILDIPVFWSFNWNTIDEKQGGSKLWLTKHIDMKGKDHIIWIRNTSHFAVGTGYNNVHVINENNKIDSRLAQTRHKNDFFFFFTYGWRPFCKFEESFVTA